MIPMKEETSSDIVKKIEEIGHNITKENIESASKQELIEYLKKVDELKALIKTVTELKK